MGLIAGVGDWGIEGLKNLALAASAAAQSAATSAQNAAASVSDGVDLGPWNANANSPTLSANASSVAVGGYYTVTVAGNASFGGTNFSAGQAFAVGDKLKKVGSAWYRSPFMLGNNSVTGAAIIAQSITPEKTTFLGPGVQLYNKNDTAIVPDTYIDNAGNLNPGAGNSVSGFIPVPASTWLTPSYTTFLTYYNAAKTVIGGELYNRSTPKFLTPSTAAFIRITVPDNLKASFMLNLGQTGLAYQDYQMLLQGAETEGSKLALTAATNAQALASQANANATAAAQNFQNSRQLYDKYDSGNEIDKYITDAGNKVNAVGYTISPFIPVTPGLQYTVSSIQFGCLFAADKTSVVSPGLLTYNRVSPTFTCPVGAAFVRLTIGDDKEVFQFQQGSGVTMGEQFGVVKLAPSVSVQSALSGKSALFLGTSIIELSTFPQLACDQLNMTCYNRGVGSSTARKADKNGNYTGIPFQNVAYSLSMTLAEKEELITNWNTYKTQLVGAPDTLTDPTKEYFRNCSYERRLVPYLNGTNPMPDLFIIEHGYNGNFASDTDAEFVNIVANGRNRNTESGAICYIIDVILSYNPHARIAIQGHYENVAQPRITQMQKALAAYWSFPYIDMASNLGFGNVVVPGSKSLYSIPPHSNYTAGNNTSQDMTQRQVYMPDKVHPHTDLTGRTDGGVTNPRMANVLAKRMEEIL